MYHQCSCTRLSGGFGEPEFSLGWTARTTYKLSLKQVFSESELSPSSLAFPAFTWSPPTPPREYKPGAAPAFITELTFPCSMVNLPPFLSYLLFLPFVHELTSQLFLVILLFWEVSKIWWVNFINSTLRVEELTLCLFLDAKETSYLAFHALLSASNYSFCLFSSLKYIHIYDTFMKENKKKGKKNTPFALNLEPDSNSYSRLSGPQGNEEYPPIKCFFSWFLSDASKQSEVLDRSLAKVWFGSYILSMPEAGAGVEEQITLDICATSGCQI